MNVRHKIIAVITFSVVLFLIPLGSYGQQLPIYSQYMMNKFLINPAVAGSEGYTAFNLTSRKQWLGIKDAPLTFAASAQTRWNNLTGQNKQARSRSSISSRNWRLGRGRLASGPHLTTKAAGLMSEFGDGSRGPPQTKQHDPDHC